MNDEQNISFLQPEFWLLLSGAGEPQHIPLLNTQIAVIWAPYVVRGI
jgi:hypothetical protein